MIADDEVVPYVHRPASERKAAAHVTRLVVDEGVAVQVVVEVGVAVHPAAPAARGVTLDVVAFDG